MKKIRSRSYNSLCYVLWCLLFYAGIVAWAWMAWPRVMVGGEPVPLDILQNPSSVKIAAAQELFQRRYFLFALLSPVAAIVFHVAYVLLGKCCPNFFSDFKKHWRRLFLSAFLILELSVWNLLFALSKNRVTGVLQIWCVFLAILCAVYLYQVIRVLCRMLKERYQVACMALLVIGYLVSIACTVLNISPLVMTLQGFEWLGEWFYSLAHPLQVPLYELIRPVQYIIALIPVVVPAAMLFLWTHVCLPRAMGTAVSSVTWKKLPSFICIEK